MYFLCTKLATWYFNLRLTKRSVQGRGLQQRKIKDWGEKTDNPLNSITKREFDSGKVNPAVRIAVYIVFSCVELKRNINKLESMTITITMYNPITAASQYFHNSFALPFLSYLHWHLLVFGIGLTASSYMQNSLIGRPLKVVSDASCIIKHDNMLFFTRIEKHP